MGKHDFSRLGDLQLAIMKIVWDRGEASVYEVQDTLSTGSDLAYTTVATTLRRMEARGLLKHRIENKRFVYSAAVTPDVVTRGMTGHLLDGLFEGSLADMVSHLLTHREVSTDELRELERLIAERKEKRS